MSRSNVLTGVLRGGKPDRNIFPHRDQNAISRSWQRKELYRTVTLTHFCLCNSLREDNTWRYSILNDSTAHRQHRVSAGFRCETQLCQLIRILNCKISRKKPVKLICKSLNMMRGHSVAKFAKQRFIVCCKRCLSFGDDRALEALRENEVKSSLRKVIDKASGKNLVMTGSVQVTSHLTINFRRHYILGNAV